MRTAKFLCTVTPFSKSKADAVAVIFAGPPVNRSASARPWKVWPTVWIEALHGAVPLQGTNTEKKPKVEENPCVCFNCPEIVTKAGCEQETEPEMVAVPVTESTDPNWKTLGAIASAGGAGKRLKTRFALETGKNEKDDTMK